MASEHIVKSFDEELNKLETALVQMGGLVEEQLTRSLNAVARRDSALAEEVLAADARIDALNVDIDTRVVRLLALRQPMAVDLRSIVAALRMATELERMGDYAANVAKRTVALNQCPYVEPAAVIPRMGKLVSRIVKDVLDAYAARDAQAAKNAWQRDEEVDEIYSSLFREILNSMVAEPSNITALTHLLFIAKNIERIGDHATNIAETVYFVVEGTQIDTPRPKGDTSPYAIISSSSEPTE
jgi:phosphate transport system protein